MAKNKNWLQKTPVPLLSYWFLKRAVQKNNPALFEKYLPFFNMVRADVKSLMTSNLCDVLLPEKDPPSSIFLSLFRENIDLTEGGAKHIALRCALRGKYKDMRLFLEKNKHVISSPDAEITFCNLLLQGEKLNEEKMAFWKRHKDVMDKKFPVFLEHPGYNDLFKDHPHLKDKNIWNVASQSAPSELLAEMIRCEPSSRLTSDMFIKILTRVGDVGTAPEVFLALDDKGIDMVSIVQAMYNKDFSTSPPFTFTRSSMLNVLGQINKDAVAALVTAEEIKKARDQKEYLSSRLEKKEFCADSQAENQEGGQNKNEQNIDHQKDRFPPRPRKL